jgi:hypothetical protein
VDTLLSILRKGDSIINYVLEENITKILSLKNKVMRLTLIEQDLFIGQLAVKVKQELTFQ